MRLVSASANPDKAAEIAAILEPLGIELVDRPSQVADVVEDADTLEANARLKAVAVSEAADGEAVVADDTGLEVDALGGAPGVVSARFAGEDATYADNVVKLLDALVELPDLEQRTARFRTVALARFADGREVVAEGVVEGVITPAPRGRSGFGYDQVFQPDEGDGRTFAEMSPDEKHAISHRGRAFRALAERLFST
jgi:XTP/dITP diphosphohydrolase